jgi:hypothetical protein
MGGTRRQQYTTHNSPFGRDKYLLTNRTASLSSAGAEQIDQVKGVNLVEK